VAGIAELLTAKLRRVAVFSGLYPLQIMEASSWKAVSRTKWSLLSITRCALRIVAIRSGLAWRPARLVMMETVSRLRSAGLGVAGVVPRRDPRALSPSRARVEPPTATDSRVTGRPVADSGLLVPLAASAGLSRRPSTLCRPVEFLVHPSPNTTEPLEPPGDPRHNPQENKVTAPPPAAPLDSWPSIRA
jgi:hypothetical protein